MTDDEILELQRKIAAARGVPTGGTFETETGRLRPLPPPDPPNFARGIPAALAEGIFLSGGDELAGFLGGTIEAARGGDFNEGLFGTRDAARAAAEEFAQAAPGVSFASNVAGGLLGGRLIGGRMLANPAMRSFFQTFPIRSGAATGAGVGAITGANQADTLAEMPDAALRGAAIGAGAGAALPVGLAVGRGAARLAGRGAAAATDTPFSAARRLLRRRIDQDDVGVDEIVERQLARSGPDDLGGAATAAESAGRNVQDLADTVAQLPGRAKSAAERAIERRSSTQFARLMSSLRRTIGSDGRVLRATREIIEQREAAAKPLYRQAFRERMPPDAVRDIGDQLEDMVENGFGTVPPLKGSTFATPIERIARKVRRLENDGATVGQIDLLKRELDKVINNTKDGGQRMMLREAKRRLIAPVDARVPAYAQARSTFSDAKSVEESFERGRKVLREDAEEVEFFLEELSDADKDAFIMGASKAIRDKVAGRVDSSTTLRTPLLRERLRNAFPDDESVDDFLKSVDGEREFSGFVQRLNNSRTNVRAEESADLAGAVPDVALDAATSGGLANLMRGVRAFFGRQREIPEPVRAELGRLLFELGPDEFAQAMRARLPARVANRVLASPEMQNIMGVFALARPSEE